MDPHKNEKPDLHLLLLRSIARVLFVVGAATAASTMAKGVRNYRIFPSRRSSSFSLLLTTLLMLTVVLLVLLALGIFSIPISRRDSPEAVDLNAFLKSSVERYEIPKLSAFRLREIDSVIFLVSFFFFLSLFFRVGFGNVCVSEARRDRGKEESSGRKCFLGSREHSSIIISWFVSEFLILAIYLSSSSSSYLLDLILKSLEKWL